MQQQGSGAGALLKGVETFGAIILGLVTLLTFVSVIARYVLNVSVPDSFDLSRYLLGIAVFFGIAAVTARRQHIAVDIVWGALGQRGRAVLDWIAALATMLFIGALAYEFWLVSLRTMRSPAATTELHIPLGYFQIVTCLGAGVAFLFAMFHVLMPKSAAKLVADKKLSSD